MERLDKVIANRGVASRREVKALVRQGRVLVDGVPAAAPDMKVAAETAVITVDGMTLGSERHIYLLLHKPAGVLTATEDKRQPTVLDLIPQELRHRDLAPVGRLDKDTEGLLLLTDDGELTHRLLSPKYHVDRCIMPVWRACRMNRMRRPLPKGCCWATACNACRPSWSRWAAANVS